MGYCTTTNVSQRFQALTISADSAFSTTKVQDMIDTNTAVIDGRLSKRYETPITGTNALLIVKQICLYFTLADIIEPLGAKETKDTELKREQDFRKLAEAMLTDIEMGRLDLSDATQVSSASSRFVNNNVDNDVCPTFKRERRQW